MNKQAPNLPYPDRTVGDVPYNAYRGISPADWHYRLSCQEVQRYNFDEFMYLLEGAIHQTWLKYLSCEEKSLLGCQIFVLGTLNGDYYFFVSYGKGRRQLRTNELFFYDTCQTKGGHKLLG